MQEKKTMTSPIDYKVIMTFGVLLLSVNVGMTPSVSDVDDFNEGETEYLSLDYWGYHRLASQIGWDKTEIVANLIEHSKHPDLIKSLIAVESSWYANARSNRSARGLMQIRNIAAIEIDPFVTESDLFDPIRNVEIGIEIFERHMNYFDAYSATEHWALTSYNRGRYGTFALGINPPETSYSRKVLELSTQNRM